VGGVSTIAHTHLEGYTPGRGSTIITPSSKKQAAVYKSLLLLWLSAIAVFQHVDFQHAGLAGRFPAGCLSFI